MGLGRGNVRPKGRPAGRLAAAAAALGLGLLAAACSNSSSLPPAGSAPCPRIAILADGADLTRFRPGAASDLTALVLDARITGFEARCDYDGRDRQALDVRLTPRFEAERGPAAEGSTADLPWFAALTDAGDTVVLARVAETTRVTFPANVQRAEATGRAVRVTVPLEQGRRAADFVLRVSFQLTPEELALNRRRGPR